MFGRESLREFIRAENESLRDVVRKFAEESDRRMEELREFNREILLRNEKVYTSVIERMERLGEEAEEGRKQLRANTEAVLKLLDRFDEKPGGAAA